MTRNRPRRPLTMAELAGEAGVSVPTVSRVLNGRSEVSEETRRKVMAVIAEHGPPRLSRPGRAVPRTEAIELLFHELESTWAIQILWGVQRAAAESGCAVMVSGLGGRFFPPDTWVEEVVARRSTAVIAALSGFTAAQHQRLLAGGVPVVVLDPPRAPLPNTPWVSATNGAGAASATRHLLELGHRRIALVAGPEEIPCAFDRLQGYRAAMADAGASVTGLVRSVSMNSDEGLVAARELLRVRPTAIVATNDLQAMGVYEAVREAGLRIPDDVSVVGFDDLSVAAWMSPGLTTVHQPLHDLAVTATDLVLCLAWGTPVPTLRLELPTHLVVRGSTAPPTPG